MAKKTDDFPLIKQQIEAGQYAPVYVLHGEESFFIDQLTELLLSRVLTEEEKDFDLTEFYGGAADFSAGDVVAACRRFPMVAERQLVLLREAQACDKRHFKFSDLLLYLKQPSPSTVFVITHKTAALTGCADVLKEAKKIGVVYQSDKVADYNLKKVLPEFLKSQGFSADAGAVEMLANYIGADFARLSHELEKLHVTLKGRTKITQQDVADHVGISREYNVFELVNAIAERNVLKVEMIRRYFASNPKAGPIVLVISSLFTFFQNLMLAYYAPDRSSSQALVGSLGISMPQAINVSNGLKRYNARITMRNISILRDFDARSKGGRGGTTPDPDLLQELFYQLMH